MLPMKPNVLFLTKDPKQIERQLAGEKLDLETIGELRDDISTDEITPIPALSYYNSVLGEHPYTGLKCGQVLPIGVGVIKKAGIQVIVAGNRYGKGSSREHSPAAEKYAGIQLVFAKSFERIYRQNADNLGLLTSTDFSLLERIVKGEAIQIEDIIQDRDDLSAKIIQSGGLLNFGKKYLLSDKRVDELDSNHLQGPKTLFQKIIQRNLVSTEVTSINATVNKGVFVQADWRFFHEYYTGMCSNLLHEAFSDTLSLHQKESIVAFEDHLSYMHKSVIHVTHGLVNQLQGLSAVHRKFTDKHGLISHGYLPQSEGSEGISHAIMAERYALPGQVVAGTDSHTCHSGALGCVAFGVGSTEMANCLVTGLIRLTMPESILIELNGELLAGVSAKDIALYLLALPEIKGGAGVGKVFEFCGGTIAALSIDERATLTNMCAELGGFTGIVAPDAETIRFLKERRNVDFTIEPWMKSDPEAHYIAHLEIDCSQIQPMLASPGDPGNGISIDVLSDNVEIDIAYGGSCTAGKREDFDAYHHVLAWAVNQGMKLPDRVTLYLQFGTVDVRDYCLEQGYLDTFEKIGAIVLEPACGACANCGPGSSTDASQVTISAINRNFPGRSGPGSVWLASPETVVASAVAGRIISFGELKNSAVLKDALNSY
ncbi:3-isopropylmalate dehydratase [Photobacterium sp. CAU 1568]|uniref:3-isopropylmalate dehydratase n=1 Tax=Photobacterium arenosum TaxID=2774143 RepID=A0ABR9BM42_9GAMM|nr:aconitase family protein [Photobacterium arenosum]MBD8513646.1 3-isopropylmalate dehydratase [Photobacterium arenosum]